MVLFLFSVLLLLISSLLLLSIFRPRSKVATLLGWYIVGFSLMVLVEEVAHFFQALDRPWVVLAIQFFFLAAIGLAWTILKRPKIGGAIFDRSLRETIEDYSDLWRGRFENLIFAFVVMLGYAYSFFLGWMVAPNTFDVIANHAVRVAFWLQHGNLTPWNSHRYLQISYPINAQLQMLWSGQFLRSDQLFFTVQWLGSLATILSVFGFARLFQYTRKQALFAALVFACFPLIWMQSSTAQNDLVAAGVFLPAVYFFILGITQRQSSMLALSGIALGLSLGTKQTIFFYLPGFAVMVGLAWWKYGRTVTRKIIQFAMASIAGFVVLASFIYIQNSIYFGNPLAPEDALGTAVSGMDRETAFGNLGYNSLRLLYNSVDNSGLSSRASNLFIRAKDLTLGSFLRLINPYLETTNFSAEDHIFSYRQPNMLAEDASWFGPVGGVFLIPIAMYQVVQAIRKKDPWRGGLVGLAVFYWLVDAWVRPGWDSYQGRYFIPAAAFLSPFLAELVRPTRLMRIFTSLVAFASILILGFTAIYNPGKVPSNLIKNGGIGREYIQTLFSMDWVDQVTLQSNDIKPMARLVENTVPEDAVIGWYGFLAQEYSIFGEDFDRKVIPVFPYDLIYDSGWLTQQQIEYIIINQSRLEGPIPEGYEEIASEFPWLIVVRK